MCVLPIRFEHLIVVLVSSSLYVDDDDLLWDFNLYFVIPFLCKVKYDYFHLIANFASDCVCYVFYIGCKKLPICF